MTNLTANIQRPYRPKPAGLATRTLPLAGYTNFASGSTAFTVYKGAVVICDVSDTDGYFRDGDSGVTLTNTDIFGGIALERVDVTSGDTADGSKSILVAVDGEWGFAKGGLAQTDVGAVCYSTDDTVATTGTASGIAMGIIVEVDATYAWVDITGYAGKVSATTT